MSGKPSSASTYLKYLPALYRAPQQEGGEPPFVAAYLKIFEKLLSGIAESSPPKGSPTPPTYLTRKGIRELLEPQVIGTLFHPRLNFLFADDPAAARTFTPPLSLGNASNTGDNLDKLRLLASYIGTEDTAAVKRWLSAFLDWIGGTVALDVDRGWGIDTKRFVIAQALPLFRARGTMDGMTWLLNAWFGLDPDAPIRLVPDGALRVVEISVSNAGFPPIEACDFPQDNAFVLEDDRAKSAARLPDIVCFDTNRQTGAERAVGYRAWYFVVTIVTVANEDPFSDADKAAFDYFEAAVKGVVDEFKPALTDYDVQVGRITLRPPPVSPGGSETDVRACGTIVRG